MEALEKIGDISEQLKSILTRPNKLDTIENSVTNIETNLANLKARTAKLEEFELTAKKEIKDLKESYNPNAGRTTQRPVQKHLENLSKQMEKEKNLHEQINELTSKNRYLESYLRRENIKFFSLPEEKDEDTAEETLRDFMEREHGYHEARSIEFLRVYQSEPRCLWSTADNCQIPAL